MQAENDVFISYAHLDDKPLDEGAKGWISDFHSLLETRLEQTIGHEILIWRDKKLTGNDAYAAEIESQLPSLKLMVSIITPRYLGSEWCKREIGAFYRAALANGGLNIGNKSRIFKIVKTPVDHEVISQLPEGLNRVFDEILDYKFYFIEPATGRFRELSRHSWVDNTIRQEYMNKLDDVVQDIANLIKLFNTSTKGADAKQKIYLAETSYDLQIYRDNLVRELEEAGYTVLPSRKLPFVADRFTTEVEGYLNQSLLSLHMVSASNYAVQPEGTDKSIVVLQHEVAAQKSLREDFKRLIWIPPAAVAAVGNESMQARQATFVRDVTSDPSQQHGADILVGPLEEFKQAIFATLRRVKEEQEAKNSRPAAGAGIEAGAASSSGKLVYLICDQRDLENTLPLEDCLMENGFEILLPLFEGDNAQLRQAHLDNLKICDAILIYYGAGNYRWVGSMKSDILRLPALGRTSPLLQKLTYLAGPSDADKQRLKANDASSIDGLDGFRPELLHSFMSALK